MGSEALPKNPRGPAAPCAHQNLDRKAPKTMKNATFSARNPRKTPQNASKRSEIASNASSPGAVRPSTARYALHRLFVALHGWHFNGLAPQGDTWASSTPTSALGDRVPEDRRLEPFEAF